MAESSAQPKRMQQSLHGNAQQWTGRLAATKRRGLNFLGGGFATFGALRAVALFVEPIFPGHSALLHIVTIVGSVLGGLRKCISTNRVTLPVRFSDSSIEIVFGDIFESDGVVVIPVNEYFDGELGDHVSPESLHGKFIDKFLNGKADWFYSLTDEALSQKDSPHLEQRNSGRCARYPIGTVVAVDIKDRRFLLAALSHTNRETLTASATLHDLDTCLIGIWKEIQVKSNGRTAVIPLIGSGLSRVGLPPRILIWRILTSFLDSTKSMKKIADKVVLVLPHRLKGEIDLAAIKRSWT